MIDDDPIVAEVRRIRDEHAAKFKSWLLEQPVYAVERVVPFVVP